MKTLTAILAVVLIFLPSGAQSGEFPTRAERAGLQTQLLNCISAFMKNSAWPGPTGVMIIAFDLDEGGRIKNVRVSRDGHLMNRPFGQLLVRGVPTCSPFKTSIIGRVEFPIVVKSSFKARSRTRLPSGWIFHIPKVAIA
jgi:hypothetical protein